eukprot:sb/3462680/
MIKDDLTQTTKNDALFKQKNDKQQLIPPMTITNDATSRPDQPQSQRVIIRNNRHKAPKTHDRVGLVIGKLPTKTNGSPSNPHAVKRQKPKNKRVGEIHTETKTTGESTEQSETTNMEREQTKTPEKPINSGYLNKTKQKTQRSLKDYMKPIKKDQQKPKETKKEVDTESDTETELDNEIMDNTNKTQGDLNIIQCNLKKKGQAMKMLGTNIVGQTNPIVLMTEPYAYKNKKVATIHKDMTIIQSYEEKPRAAIALPKKMAAQAWKMDIGNEKDACTILIKHEKTNIILSSIYMDQTKDINTKLIKQIKDRADKLKAKLIIGTDTNSHHKKWGDKNTDKRGETLMEAINENALQWLNKGQKPTFVNSRGQSTIIDVTLVNKDATRDIKDWRVSDEPTSSDHRYIRFKMRETTRNKKRRIEGNTDWNKFRDEIKKSRIIKEIEKQNIQTYKELNRASHKLHKEIMRCWKIACPLTYSSGKPNKLIWQKEEVNKAKIKIIKLLNKRKNRKNTKKIDRKLIIANEEYEKIAMKAQQQSWSEFTGNITGTHQAARLNKILKLTGQHKIQPGTIKDKADKPATSPAESLKNLLDYHFGENTTTSHIIKYSKERNGKEENTFSKEKIARAINTLPLNKAPGPDGVSNGMLKEGAGLLNDAIATIFKASHRLQTPPENWTYKPLLYLQQS